MAVMKSETNQVSNATIAFCLKSIIMTILHIVIINQIFVLRMVMLVLSVLISVC